MDLGRQLRVAGLAAIAHHCEDDRPLHDEEDDRGDEEYDVVQVADGARLLGHVLGRVEPRHLGRAAGEQEGQERQRQDDEARPLLP